MFKMEEAAVPPFTTGITALVVIVGVAIVGEVANTSGPVPVSSVTAEARFALEGVARNVATLDPRPDTPVLIGNPVQFVSVPEVGVPRTGVTSVGVLANTKAPVPVPATSDVINLVIAPATDPVLIL